jgi:hypothetical protein
MGSFDGDGVWIGNGSRVKTRFSMGRWHTTYATECGHEVHILEDWDTPRLCKECKAANDAKWYDKSCEDCGATIHVCKDWDNEPRFCKTCKVAREAKWYDKSCENCGNTMRANRDWDHPPKFCDECKREYAPKSAECEHCNSTFTIPMGTQINCKQHGWDLPKKCLECREKFRHKPFKTVREETFLGKTVYRTYNSIGQLIAESANEKTFWTGTDQRRHKSRTGSTIGITRKRERFLTGTPYRETTRPDGSVKSTAEEKTRWLSGQPYTESTGGTSGTKHTTTTKTSRWSGKKYRETQ